MQRELGTAAPPDDGRAGAIDDIVVPGVAGADALVALVRLEDHLHQVADAAAAVELDAELLAHPAAAAVATHQVSGAQRLVAAVHGAGRHGHALAILLEVHE